MANILKSFSSAAAGFLTRSTNANSGLISSTCDSVAGGTWSYLSVRTNVRNHFPKPREVKRIRVHGWEKRLSTPGGRRIIMRRILKGRHVITH